MAVKLITENCTGCRLCLRACPYDAIDIVDDKASFNASSEHVCPQGQGRAKRVLSPVPSIFKGPGFYVTDHRKTAPSD